MGRRRDRERAPLWAEILGRVIPAVFVVIFNACMASIWHSPPEAGKIVAVASFGDDGVVTNWYCEDDQGVYSCNSARRSDDNEERTYLAIPFGYGVIDSYGGANTGDEKFACLHLASGDILECTITTDFADFWTGDVIQGYPEGQLVSIAERQRGNIWQYYAIGDRVFSLHNGEFEEVEIANGYRFLKASAFTSSDPILWCRSPLEDTMRCPEPGSGIENFTNFYPNLPVLAAGYGLINLFAVFWLSQVAVNVIRKHYANRAKT